jgi:hypothetical protein
MNSVYELEISASYLDILLNIDSTGRLTTTLYDKRDDFDFAIINFSFLCSNIPLSHAYGVYSIRKSMFRFWLKEHSCEIY